MARQVGSRFSIVLDDTNAIYVYDEMYRKFYTFDLEDKHFFEDCSDDIIITYLTNIISRKRTSQENQPCKRQRR